MAGLAVIATLAVQLYSDSMILAGLVGVAILSCAGIFKWKEADDVIITGMRMMALVGFIMIAAQGFAAVIEATNQVPALVEASVNWIGDSQGTGSIPNVADWPVNYPRDWFIFLNRADSSHYLCASMYAVRF